MTIEGSIYGRNVVFPEKSEVSLTAFSQMVGVDRYALIRVLGQTMHARPARARGATHWYVTEHDFPVAVAKVVESYHPDWGINLDTKENFHVERIGKKGAVVFDYRYPQK